MRSSEDIRKELEATIASRDAMEEKNLPKRGIEFANKKIKKLEAELESALEEESKPTGPTEAEIEAERIANEAIEAAKEEKRLADLAEEEEKKQKAKLKPKNPVKITGDNLDDCKKSIQEQGFRIQKISERQKNEKPKTKRKVSTILAENFIKALSGAISHEMTLEAVLNIEVSKIEEAIDHMAKALIACRAGLGGIEDDNSTMVQTFRKNGKELVDSIIDLQEKAKLKNAA
jgi:hypothetical protein